MKPKVYIETTIPSFYFERRTQPEMVARKEWTRRWWTGAEVRYALLTSAAVIEELNRGTYAAREDCLALVEPLGLLETEPPIAEIVHTYLAHHVMPQDPGGDAIHLALASYHKCDFLLT